MKNVSTRIVAVFRRYITIHGPLLAKGLSFSALFASIPLLFLLSVAGSIALTPEVRDLLQNQFLSVLPAGVQESIIFGMDRLAANPGSLSLLTVVVFLWSVHQLFFDLHRVVRAGFGLPVSPARGRTRAMGTTGVFLLMIYAVALVNLASRYVAPYLPMSGTWVRLVTVLGSTVLLALVLWSVLRLASGVPLKPLPSGIVALSAAGLWQTVSWLAGVGVRVAARRLIVYGVLASAVLFLMLMRVYAEIILHSTLWIREMSAERVSPPDRGVSVGEILE